MSLHIFGMGDEMGLREAFEYISSNHTETKENHKNERLQTRYYKLQREKTMQGVEAVLKKHDFEIKQSGSERGEIIAVCNKGQKQLAIATVITVKPFKTAVDFSISTESILPGDFGKSKNKIISLYEQLDKEIPFIGTGLGDQLL